MELTAQRRTLFEKLCKEGVDEDEGGGGWMQDTENEGECGYGWGILIILSIYMIKGDVIL